MAPTGAISKLKNEARRAQYKAGQERADGACAVEARPEDAKNKARGDRRADIGLNALQVNVKLAADVSDERNPEQAEEHHDACGDAAEIDELLLGRLGTNLFVEVESDERGRGIEDRAHGTHDSGEQSGHHEPNQANRKQIKNERWIGEVGLFDLVGEKGEGNDARENEHEDGQNLQDTGENRSGLGVSLITRREHALHDDLVGTPIPDPENRSAEKDAGPWKIRIGNRLDHVEVIGRHHGAEVFETADASQADNREGDSAGNQN